MAFNDEPIWPYGTSPQTYIQQAMNQPLTSIPWFRTRYAAPPPQDTPLRQQLMQVFGNALMSQQQFPQLMQALMQNPGQSRTNLGLLSPPASYSPDQNFWRINWNLNPSTGSSANTSSAAGGNPVYGTHPAPYEGGGGGSANGATGAAGAGSSQGGEAGSVGASVGGNTDAGGAASGTGSAGVGAGSATADASAGAVY
jgi:hypothetical protein